MRNHIGNKSISIIVSASDYNNSGIILENYLRQPINKKELIIVVNNDLANFDRWFNKFKDIPMTRIYQLDEDSSLGYCLNYCIGRSIFDYIALFNESHFYSSNYLSVAINAIVKAAADLVGKKAHYIYDKQCRQIRLNEDGAENCYTDFVKLSTFIFKRELFERIIFIDSDYNLDTEFCRDCTNKGLRIYSTGRGSYLYIQ